MIESGIEYLREVQKECLALSATYRRTDGTGIFIKAVPGRSIFRSTNDYGVWTRTETRDFIIDKDYLDDPPVKGDMIIFRDREYEVLAPNDEPVWKWSDPFCTAYRIHTKHTGGKA